MLDKEMVSSQGTSLIEIRFYKGTGPIEADDRHRY